MNIHPCVKKIEDHLESNNFWFERFVHEPVRTSEEAANVRDGYSLAQGAKALIVRLKDKSGKRFAMIVVPGDSRFESKKAREIIGVKDIRFATPEEVSNITEGVVPGGVPPWGNLFNLEVYADENVFKNEKIIFNAGDKRVSIGMKVKDYLNIVQPKVVSIT